MGNEFLTLNLFYLCRAAIFTWLGCTYLKTIREAADFDGGICRFTRKLQFQFINKVRTRPVINLNILDLNKLLEKCTVQVVIENVGCRNEDRSAHKSSSCSVLQRGLRSNYVCISPESN